jgi:hypothetical protein
VSNVRTVTVCAFAPASVVMVPGVAPAIVAVREHLLTSASKTTL